MSIAELQVYSVEEADVTGGVCVVRCVGGTARAGQVYAVGESRLGLRRIERHGRPVGSFGAGHTARVHFTGAMVALLSRGQVLTAVPPAGHALADLEAWLATGPPLDDEPQPRTLRVLAGVRMRDDRLPDAVRLRWGRVALAATHRCARAEALPDLVRAPELACVQVYLIEQFGPGPGGDPAELCGTLLALIDLSPEQAAAQGGGLARPAAPPHPPPAPHQGPHPVAGGPAPPPGGRLAAGDPGRRVDAGQEPAPVGPGPVTSRGCSARGWPGRWSA
ncbi:hypothetical protein [Streptomyces sp. NPDC090112]|uniref:hypothetical protein n=1 Tax=Streptomyces sp. NPDC090112 TaxID=3365949 RepID=UPI003815199E